MAVGGYSYKQYYGLTPEELKTEYERNRRRKAFQPEVVYEAPEKEKSLETGKVLRAIFVMAVIGILAMAALAVGARAKTVKNSINVLQSKNTQLESEIALLHVTLNSATSIESVEAYAKDQLGMTYATQGQTIYITSPDYTDSLASTIRSKAYAVNN